MSNPSPSPFATKPPNGPTHGPKTVGAKKFLWGFWMKTISKDLMCPSNKRLGSKSSNQVKEHRWYLGLDSRKNGKFFREKNMWIFRKQKIKWWVGDGFKF